MAESERMHEAATPPLPRTLPPTASPCSVPATSDDRVLCKMVSAWAGPEGSGARPGLRSRSCGRRLP